MMWITSMNLSLLKEFSSECIVYVVGSFEASLRQHLLEVCFMHSLWSISFATAKLKMLHSLRRLSANTGTNRHRLVCTSFCCSCCIAAHTVFVLFFTFFFEESILVWKFCEYLSSFAWMNAVVFDFVFLFAFVMFLFNVLACCLS